MIKFLDSFAYGSRAYEVNCDSIISDALGEYITGFHNKIRSELVRGQFQGYERETDIYTMVGHFFILI